MDDLPGVDRFEALGDLDRQGQALADGKLAAAKQPMQGLPGEALKDQRRRAAEPFQSVDLDDPRAPWALRGFRILPTLRAPGVLDLAKQMVLIIEACKLAGARVFTARNLDDDRGAIRHAQCTVDLIVAAIVEFFKIGIVRQPIHRLPLLAQRSESHTSDPFQGESESPLIFIPFFVGIGKEQM